MQDIYDQVEDERAGGATLEEIAATLSLPYRVVEVAAGRNGARTAAPSPTSRRSEQVVEDAFQSDVGVENNPVRAENSILVFYDVLEIVPERDRTLDEVREELAACLDGRGDASAASPRWPTRCSTRLQNGEALTALAAEIGKPVRDGRRRERGRETPPRAQRQRRGAGLRRAGGPRRQCRGDTPPARILLKVDSVTAPAFFAEAADAEAIEGAAFAGDRATASAAPTNSELLQSRDVEINNAALAQLTGTAPTQ